MQLKFKLIVLSYFLVVLVLILFFHPFVIQKSLGNETIEYLDNFMEQSDDKVLNIENLFQFTNYILEMDRDIVSKSDNIGIHFNLEDCNKYMTIYKSSPYMFLDGTKIEQVELRLSNSNKYNFFLIGVISGKCFTKKDVEKNYDIHFIGPSGEFSNLRVAYEYHNEQKNYTLYYGFNLKDPGCLEAFSIQKF